MKRPASPRSLLTVPFAIPAYWTPDQALAVVELLDGLRELIWARYGLQLLDERRAKLQPFADCLFPTSAFQKNNPPAEWTTHFCRTPRRRYRRRRSTIPIILT
jgi:hypothetical protein